MTAAATPQQWAERAAIYLAAPSKPTTALMQHYDVPRSTAGMWANQLRARGLIPTYGKGRTCPPVTVTAECDCGWQHTTQDTAHLNSVIAAHRRTQHVGRNK